MKRSRFEAIVSIIKQQLHAKDCISTLVTNFPGVPSGTLLSIYSQQYQNYTKSIHGSHRKPEAMAAHYAEYRAIMNEGVEKPNLLLEMSAKVKLSPVLFSRIILEQYTLDSDHLLPPNTGTAPTTTVLVSQWIKNPGKIPDSNLQEQVKRCVLGDTNYGPLAENMKHSLGYEYEFLLKEKIDELQIPYLDEKALRLRGYDKTPDFKLEAPIAVGEDYVVNWIESKASFGDARSHSCYLEEQYWSYQNRFGSGLVIYWFGFIEELDTLKKQGIMLLDHFPSGAITTLKQSLKQTTNVTK